MTPTKYEELCAALDRTENIKATFRQLFTEKFSNFMNCPTDSIELNINETASSLNPLTYRAELVFKISTGLNETFLRVDGITLKHHHEKAPNYQYVCSYKSKDVLIESNPSSLFFDILKELQKTLISED